MLKIMRLFWEYYNDGNNTDNDDDNFYNVSHFFLTGLDEYLDLLFCESSERVGARSAICVASVSFEVYAFFKVVDSQRHKVKGL